MTNQGRFSGDRLREAREIRGMSAASLAESIEVSRQSISQYEKGRQFPSRAVLDRISSVLNIPRQRFFVSPCSYELGVIFYRSMSSSTKTERVRAERRFCWMLESFDILCEYLEFPTVTLPEIRLPHNPSKIRSDEIESAARLVRDSWGLSDRPIANLNRHVENAGCIVVRHDLWAETLDAFSVWSVTHERPFIVLGKGKASACRSRWDAAHELGHLLFHRYIDTKTLSKPAEFRLIEDQAHWFAGALLMPEESFSDDLYSTTLDAFLSIKERWKVSIAAMIQRAWHLNIIDDSERRRLFIGMNRRQWRQSEPLDDEIAFEEPRLLRIAVEKLIENDIVSLEEIPFRLGLSGRTVEKLLNLRHRYLDPNHTPDGSVPQIIKIRRAQ